jgi:acetyl esterase/lipase
MSLWRTIAAAALLWGAAGAARGGDGVLYFTIGMHIEPLGTTAQGYRSGQGDYRQPALFRRHVEDMRAVARIVESHGGRMTIQAQSPFTSVAAETGETVLSDLAARGHEIALHFHEDAHLGQDSSLLGADAWCSVMQAEIGLIGRAAPGVRIRYWSGGNLYPDIYRAAACAGLDVNSDWKNPRTQSTPLEIVGVNPWRPAGGTDGNDFTLFARHDANGRVVFLPEGQYDTTDFAAMRRSQNAGGDAAYFDYLKRMLLASVEAARADRVNVFHFTVHPGEFRGDPQQPFAVIERFLAEAVDPLAAEGKLKWATFSEMADAFSAWEQANPGVEPRPVQGPPGGGAGKRGYITFAVNVHDWTHADESARTLLRLAGLFERYQVRGDFYFTPEVTRKLAAEHPEVIEKLRNSNMTISYHVRPPHPLYAGFGRRLKELDDEALAQALLDYETYALDPATAELDRRQPGGYRYVAEVFGRAPVVASAPNSDARIRDAAERLYAWLGAKVTVRYHEEGARIDRPFETVNELLIRPSDFSITRVTLPGGGQNFWWNLIHGEGGAQYRPARMLEERLAEWERRAPGRPPLVTALIHENNFVRRGPEGWTSIYFAMEGGQRGAPLAPPYDLSAPDPSQLRPEAEQEAIWAAYEEMVALAARELHVITAEDLPELARTGLGGEGGTGSGENGVFHPGKLGTVERDVTYCSPGGVPQRMDVYYPASAAGRWPALVFIHGGGWTGGDKAQGGPELAALRDAGFLVVSINYRLGPQYKFPAMIEDAKCAVRYLRAHAAVYNLDPERMGVWGSSAGGHLAALLGTADAAAGFDTGEFLEQSSRVQAVTVFFGPTDLTVPFPGGYASKLEVFAPFDAALASPVTYVTPDDPPFLLVHGDSDTLVPLSQSEILLARLGEAGVRAELIVVANAGHGLSPAGGAPVSPARPEIVQRVVDFFRKQLRME